MSAKSIVLTAAAASVLAGCAQTRGIVRDGDAEAQRPATGNSWFDDAQAALAARKDIKLNKRRAKNVILFVADGMDPTTVTAARIYDGQTRGEEGEENLLSFETFPHLAMSKTYTTDFQVADSAGTMSAMVTGVKTRSGVLSISHEPEQGDCAGGLAHEVKTLGELSEMAGMAVGVVSTASITHATPGAVYAHSAARGWEGDDRMPPEAIEAGCKDIAQQLIEFPYGDGLEVAFGGGRQFFLPESAADPEYSDKTGTRKDNRDLTAEWTTKSDSHVFVWNKRDFDALTPKNKALGLFEPSHVNFELQRSNDASGEPSLTEMTRKAIEILSLDEDGFFLMVESGKVDHAHHAGNALGALSETQEYSKAIAAARAMTDEQETLIVVTADHGHTLAFQGYPMKGNNILGLVMVPGEDAAPRELLAAGDQKPYTTLGYANGPGSVFGGNKNVTERTILTPEMVSNPEFRLQALVPTGSETHGGQDVTIYASGPRAYLLSGVVEQNYIFHVIDDALGLWDRTKDE